METVCRALSKLKRAGVVDLPRSNQLVQNLDSLRAFRNSSSGNEAASTLRAIVPMSCPA